VISASRWQLKMDWFGQIMQPKIPSLGDAAGGEKGSCLHTIFRCNIHIQHRKSNGHSWKRDSSTSPLIFNGQFIQEMKVNFPFFFSYFSLACGVFLVKYDFRKGKPKIQTNREREIA